MKRIYTFSAVLMIGMVIAVSVGRAAVPQLINYQGRLTDNLGDPVADNSYSVVFTIYDAAAAGTSVWTETKSVNTVDGLFAVLLGSVTPIEDTVFNGVTRYLGIKVDADLELSPRTMLISVPYAHRVNTVDGASGGNITSKVSIGPGHTNTGVVAFVAGANNTSSGDSSTISGGGNNTASGSAATIGGGSFNTASGNESTVAGGVINSAFGNNSTIGGGFEHVAVGTGSTISGGASNTASGVGSTVSGGDGNTASGNNATVSGGSFNRARGHYSVVGGGGGPTSVDSNLALGLLSVVSGGGSNVASSIASTIGGGGNNTASDSFATVAGGFRNTANASQATVGGGQVNTASNIYATVGGGKSNTANGQYSTGGGGDDNTAAGDYATVGGGQRNEVFGAWSTVPGGLSNTAGGSYSFAAGRRAHASHSGSFVWADSSDVDFASTADEQFLIRASGGVGIGTTTPQGALDVSSTTSGLVVPRMTTAQRNSLTLIDGTIVFDTNLQKFLGYGNGQWNPLSN